MFAATKASRRAAAPAIRATASTQTLANTSTLAISKPTGTTVGDVLLVVAGANGGSTSWSAAAAWTELLDTGARPSTFLAYRNITAGDAATTEFSFVASTNRVLGGSLIAIKNGTFDLAGANAHASAGIVTAPAVQASRANSLLLGVYVDESASSAFVTPSGMATVVANTDATGPSWHVFQQNIGSNSGVKISTATSNNSELESMLLLIKPL